MPRPPLLKVIVIRDGGRRCGGARISEIRFFPFLFIILISIAWHSGDQPNNNKQCSEKGERGVRRVRLAKVRMVGEVEHSFGLIIAASFCGCFVSFDRCYLAFS